MNRHSNITVSIVIPNWNGKALLSKHLPTVLSTAPKAEIIVSDDASTDGSVELIHNTFPTVQVVASVSQKGFSSTVNMGVQKATGEIVVLLNTDVEPTPDFLSPLLSHFTDKSVFAVGCMDKSVEGNNIILRGRGIAEWNRGLYVHRRGDLDSNSTAWVSCGSGAFRKSMWDTLGGLDEGYNPFYWEDIDLSYRALKAGWKVIFERTSVVIHKHEIGKIKSSQSPFFVRSIAYRNQFQFIWKNISDPILLFSHALHVPIILLKALFRLDMALITGYIAALLRLPTILTNRIGVARTWKRTDKQILQVISL